MRKYNTDARKRHLSDRDFSLFEAAQRQAQHSDFAFVDDCLIHFPSESVVDPINESFELDPEQNYSLMLEIVQRCKRRLEKTMRRKTPADHEQIVLCDAIQDAFGDELTEAANE